MRTAPFDCHACGRRIEPRAHCIVCDRFVLCVSCMENRRNHATYYPDCSAPWHDMFDHGVMFATRAAAALLLRKTAS
jgi:hypothetical protein